MKTDSSIHMDQNGCEYQAWPAQYAALVDGGRTMYDLWVREEKTFRTSSLCVYNTTQKLKRSVE